MDDSWDMKRSAVEIDGLDDLVEAVADTHGPVRKTGPAHAGVDNGIGLIALRFYRIDRSGHIAGHATLASGGVPTDHRPEQVSRLAVEFRAEAWGVAQFARQLAELARTQEGRASLVIEEQA